MPELPEVETTRRGLIPWMRGARIADLVVRDPRLRWPIEPDLRARLRGRLITDIGRRGKYLLVWLDRGALILHLGMSGSLKVVGDAPAGPHDPFDLVLAGTPTVRVRLRDPRRFGALLYSDDPRSHPLIAGLGPEPLEPGFTGATLHARAHRRTTAIRDLLLNGHIVAGIGNIYANEALFAAGIHPRRAAGRIAARRYDTLARAIVTVLSQAVAAGGTTLKDFSASDGRPGYFQQKLQVYGRTGEACPRCATPIARLTVGARSCYYCPHCQR
ncbi:bifunctional DNA-formamidopyrimidine glycosylase/DNA-(apurinic or apyrimidinic site) lyase [Acidiferrobacter sp.]|uniref:bifunctional DNA-formamidopyrimidine glycosylase/DNA-(apurinic or apyrimidinic site) lyase n=1 Tax=Acidiferrobacter sp. TaxID=1872107 RepID=UPI00261FED09|nr:bifunctional DNA-formamidopyrimidine glycosylase/DNA-(apurinic or apyrimidinic site) lyase [Acidiferrobacter sp.]